MIVILDEGKQINEVTLYDLNEARIVRTDLTDYQAYKAALIFENMIDMLENYKMEMFNKEEV